MATIRASSPGTAFAVATLGIAFFSAMDAVMKGLTIEIGAFNAMFWRVLAGALFGGLVYFALRTPWPTKEAMRVHLIRGGMTSVMGVLFFVYWTSADFVERQTEATLGAEVNGLSEQYTQRGLSGLVQIVAARSAGDRGDARHRSFA